MIWPRYFESSTAAKQVVFPNPDLEPEYTYNVDLSYTQVFADKFTIEVTGFYTLFRNAIVKAPFQLNGQDSVLYNGVMCQVLASQNLNKANLYGINAAINFAFTSYLSLTSTINFTEGEFETDPSKTTFHYQKQPDGTYKLVQANVSSKPLDHIPPVFGKTSLLYSQKKWERLNFMLFITDGKNWINTIRMERTMPNMQPLKECLPGLP
jgi:hemoglobin/transferrin/lactoferrin receptor protein